MDDIERAIDDAVNVYRCSLKDGRFVYGGGAAEMVDIKNFILLVTCYQT
jgi:chaperonin GroEL (HSP60 family)